MTKVNSGIPLKWKTRFEMTKVYSLKWKTSDLEWPKITPEYPPQNEKLQIWDDQNLVWNTPQNEKLQIWDDQSLLRNTPPQNEKLQIWNDQSLLRNTSPMKNFRFEMTKVYSGISPPKWKTSDLRWPKFSLEYPPKWKTSDLRWPKLTPEYPP